MLSSHRAVTRVVLAALSFTFIIAFGQQAPVTQAGPEAATVVPRSLLPQNVGVGVSTDNAVTIAFDAAMNPGSVEDALQVLPAQPVELTWSENLDQLTVAPDPTVAHRRDVPRRDRRHCAAHRRASPALGRALFLHHPDRTDRLRLPGAPGGRESAAGRRSTRTPSCWRQTRSTRMR